MSTTSLRGVAFGLALVLATASLSPAIAEAGNRRNKHHRNNGRSHHRVVERRDHHDRDYDRYRNRSQCNSNVGTFLGGVAVGAIIGHHTDRYPPPPPPPRRAWTYDCDPCGYHNQSYDSWVVHLTVVHEVPRCDIAASYPPNYCGHWEDY